MWIYICIILILIFAFVVAVIYHDTHTFVVRNYEVLSDKVERDYTFVLLSDLHGYEFGKDNVKLYEAVDEVSPDAILVSGDMFTAEKIKGEIQYRPGFELLSSLSSKYKIYYGNGNHEHKMKVFTKEYGNFYDRYRNKLTQKGIVFLENDSVVIDDNIRITGLDLGLEYFKKITKKSMDKGYINRLVGDSSKEKFNVLIAHNPQYFNEYTEWGANLTVSGHVHGGIVRLPLIGGVISPAIALFPRFDGGKFEKEGNTMILSRGLGTHTIHVRFYNPGEVCVIRIRKA